MKLLGLYKWIIGTMSDFVKQFQNNETLYDKARAFWGDLESYSIFIVFILSYRPRHSIKIGIWRSQDASEWLPPGTTRRARFTRLVSSR